MSAPRRALLLMTKGPNRVAATAVLKQIVEDVAAASDPFDATARFAEEPADLVVASLAGFRAHDLAFLSAVGEKGGDPVRYLHLGMRSSDVMDTAYAVQLKEAADRLRATVATFLSRLGSSLPTQHI